MINHDKTNKKIAFALKNVLTSKTMKYLNSDGATVKVSSSACNLGKMFDKIPSINK